MPGWTEPGILVVEIQCLYIMPNEFAYMYLVQIYLVPVWCANMCTSFPNSYHMLPLFSSASHMTCNITGISKSGGCILVKSSLCRTIAKERTFANLFLSRLSWSLHARGAVSLGNSHMFQPRQGRAEIELSIFYTIRLDLMLPLRRDPCDQRLRFCYKGQPEQVIYPAIMKSNQRHDSTISLSSIRMGCSMKQKGKISMILVVNISCLLLVC